MTQQRISFDAADPGLQIYHSFFRRSTKTLREIYKQGDEKNQVVIEQIFRDRNVPIEEQQEQGENLQIGKVDYEERKEEKKEAYERLAQKNKEKANAGFERSHKMAEVIPFGQPILVGHHSEKADRNYRKKINKVFENAIEDNKKADYYSNKVQTIENSKVISIDDPEALKKLECKLETIKAKIEKVKEHNKNCKPFIHLYISKFREGYEQIWNDNGSGDYAKIINGKLIWVSKRVPEEIKAKIETYHKTGKLEQDPIPEDKKVYAAYVLQNLNANKSTIQKRIESLKAKAKIEEIDETTNGINLVVDQNENRVMIYFPGKPNEEIRSKLKHGGFRWSPRNTAWQAFISNRAIMKAREIIKEAI